MPARQCGDYGRLLPRERPYNSENAKVGRIVIIRSTSVRNTELKLNTTRGQHYTCANEVSVLTLYQNL